MEAKISKTLDHMNPIGAGPDAVDLITVRGARLLGEAEVALHGALVSPEVFQYCPQTVLTAVGKRCGKRSTAQRFINRQLIDLATKYQRVMRLKGGSPMLFGRVGEELQTLEQAGVDYEVVPGITAALTAASTIRQPLTKHGAVRSVASVMQAKATNPDTPQPEGAVPGPVAQVDSLIHYMGRDQTASIIADLIARDRASSTPAWVVGAATMPEQCSACFTLQQVASGAATKQIDAEHPSLLMIGDALTVRASMAASESALGTHPHSLAA